jgi:hypothetical protein
LEKIVTKARLIADMMVKMHSKVKDSNLRHLGDDSRRNKNKTYKNIALAGTTGAESDEEEFKKGLY